MILDYNCIYFCCIPEIHCSIYLPIAFSIQILNIRRYVYDYNRRKTIALLSLPKYKEIAVIVMNVLLFIVVMLTPHPGVLQNIKDGGRTKTTMNVYNMHIFHFCRIGFLQKQILWVDRTYGIRSSLRYIIFADRGAQKNKFRNVDTAMTSLCNQKPLR